MSDKPVRRALQQIHAPDELDAQRRAWAVVRGDFEDREPISWRRRNRGPLLAAAAAVVVLLAAALSSPGRALVGSVRDAVTSEPHAKPRPALTALPAPGDLLVNSRRGLWIVHFDGSKRLLSTWWEGAWSPEAKYVAVTRGHELAAIDPSGAIRCSIARNHLVRAARWS